MAKKNLKLYVFNYIKKNEKLPPTMSPSKTAYYTKQLREGGYVKKLGSSGIWKVTKPFDNLLQKKVQLMRGMGSRKGIRSHAYRFKLKIPYLERWEDRKKYLRKQKIPFKELPYGECVIVRRHKVHLYNDSILIMFYTGKSFRVASAKEGDEKALLEVKLTIESLENKLKTNLKVGRSWMINCYSKHHALIRNSLAKWHRARGINKFSIKGADGKEWLLMDNSFNLEELECTHSVKATIDTDTIVAPFMNKLRENPVILDDLEQKTKEIADLKKILHSTIELVKSNAFLHKELVAEVKTLTTK